jgi:hypothetical protein
MTRRKVIGSIRLKNREGSSAQRWYFSQRSVFHFFRVSKGSKKSRTGLDACPSLSRLATDEAEASQSFGALAISLLSIDD